MIDGARHVSLSFWFSDHGSALPEDPPNGVEFGRDRTGSNWARLKAPNVADEWVGAHLDSLWDVAGPWLLRLVQVDTRPDYLILRVVQYSRPDDDCSPGFSVDANWIEVLGALGGLLDLDLYCYPPRALGDSSP